jgi:hypothetical protein
MPSLRGQSNQAFVMSQQVVWPKVDRVMYSSSRILPSVICGAIRGAKKLRPPYIVGHISFSLNLRFAAPPGLGMNTSSKATTMKFKIDEYRAGAVRCEMRAKEMRNRADREWQMTLSRAYRILAEAEAERSGLRGREILANREAA